MKPRLLDLFCCEGGAAMGYHRAGFEVVGVDVVSRKRRYPFQFVQADALEYVTEHWQEFDAIHASPPCQLYSITNHNNRPHPDLVGPTRDALTATGLPYVIENVPGAPLSAPVTLCGTMFDLTADDGDGEHLWMRRHRLFESNLLLWPNGECRCPEFKAREGWRCAGAYGGGSNDKVRAREVRKGGYTPPTAVRAALLGIDWMTQYGLSQSIPPIYTEWLGGQLLAQLTTTEDQ